MTRSGLYLAIAAIAVTAPRLILAFLEADGIEVAGAWRTGLLGLTGVATGVVLTGGGAYLARALTWSTRHRGLLAATWLLVLTCSGVLITPVLVAGLAARPLAAVLATPALGWLWSAVAVLAVELVAAGAMAAHSLEASERSARERTERELLAVASERNRLRQELERMRQERSARSESDAGAAARKRERRRRRIASSGGSASPAAAAARSLDFSCPWGCGFQGGSQNALNAHVHYCRRRPSNATDSEASAELPDQGPEPQSIGVLTFTGGPLDDAERSARS